MGDSACRQNNAAPHGPGYIGRNQTWRDAPGVSASTIKDFEGGRRVPMPNNLKAIREAIERADVELLFSNGHPVGIKVKRHVAKHHK